MAENNGRLRLSLPAITFLVGLILGAAGLWVSVERAQAVTATQIGTLRADLQEQKQRAVSQEEYRATIGAMKEQLSRIEAKLDRQLRGGGL